MFMSNPFSVEEVSKQEGSYRYKFIGSIDANAAKALDSLDSVQAGSHVLLDFSQVDRVNSMGLSLLLKLFEQWEQNKVKVEVQRLSKMANMLFKITGLGRFVGKPNKDGQTGLEKDVVEPLAPRHAVPKQEEIVPVHTPHDKLNFVAALQSGQQLTGWYLLNTYLQRKLNRAVHFEQANGAPDAAMTDLFFAKPFEACAMMEKYRFIPLLKPVAEPDEVVLLTRINDSRSLKELEGLTVSVASEGSFVYLLGRFLCDENGIDSSKFNFDFSGNEIKALQSLIRGKSDLMFMLKRTYQGLSSFSRNSVQKLDESDTDFASHLLCMNPHIRDQAASIVDVLVAMNEDSQGNGVLSDIQFQGWVKPEAGELQMLQMVYKRYT